MKISIVVACGLNGEIGFGGDLLWNLPKDMKYFKILTTNHHVLMGRRTYESIPEKFRPLKGRINLIVSKTGFTEPNCHIFSDIETAIEFAKESGENELMVIGGGQIYEQVFSKADIIYLTKVHSKFSESDTFFREILLSEWDEEVLSFQTKDENHLYDFEFIKLTKK